MAQATFSVHMDEDLKHPFEIQASEEVTRTSGMQAFLALRAEAEKNGIQDLSLYEINEEIYQAR
jgi:DNA-damage-inducible protein J